MVSPLAAVLAQAANTKPVYMLPVTVTQISPLQVNLDGTVVPAVGITGLSYSLGAAVALISEGGEKPLIIPTTGV